MIRMPRLPFLPGYSFDSNIGKTDFRKHVHLCLLQKGIPYTCEEGKPQPFQVEELTRYPSLAQRRDVFVWPAWKEFEKQTLTFDAFFQDALWEFPSGANYRIRKVKILFFLEDGTITVMEPKTENSGMTQGVLIKRHRIPFPKPMDNIFYDIADLNVGQNVEFYGKVFKIYNCDPFTRNFLTRCGIRVGDQMVPPDDPMDQSERDKKKTILPKRPNSKVDTLGKFLAMDRQVLRFWVYWDDRDSEFGIVHKFTLMYFLQDDTIQLMELHSSRCGCDTGYTFLRRQKLPKCYTHLLGPGEAEQFSFLNVVPCNNAALIDALNCGYKPIEYYSEADLALGTAINVFGRKMVLYKCDEYTKEFYRKKYGIEQFKELPVPVSPDDEPFPVEKKIPPWNGFGSFEASIGNCLGLIPKEPPQDFTDLMDSDQEHDVHMLRLGARMLSDDPLNADRIFLITFILRGNKVQVFEFQKDGRGGGKFQRFRQMFKPNQDFFVSFKPDVYTKDDFWVGNTIELEKFKYLLTEADEYTLRYMELNCRNFPKSNINIILEKLRKKLRPQYKDFVCKYLRPCIEDVKPGDCTAILPFQKLRTALQALMCKEITEHEIITVARYFRAQMRGTRWSKEQIQQIIKFECRRLLFNGADRLEENLRYRDTCKSGYIPFGEARSLVLGAHIPVDIDLIDTMMEMVDRDEKGYVSIQDVMTFVDFTKYPVVPVLPMNLKREFSVFTKRVADFSYSWVDCMKFLKELGLEEELKEESCEPELCDTQAEG